MGKDLPARKLAVILHADVVGSTALVQQNDSLAHQRIQQAFQRFSATIASYGGQAREIRGDALVAEFDRASDAVAAALAFQVANQAFNSTLIDAIQPRLRIGISLGEVIIADDTMTGAGIVLAQRLEQLADAGKVVVQGSVYDTVPTRLPFAFESLGELSLKGFDQPVRALTVNLRAGHTLPAPDNNSITQTPGSEESHTRDQPSIAVLPFTNMSADSEQEFFADGMAEDIITALSQVTSLNVIARNSSFAYKGRSVKVQAIAKDLNVRYVLEGSVRKSANRARITAQLIDAADGNHLWAERYDRELDDVFEIQDEITRNVCIALQVKLTSGHAAFWQGGTGSFEAWQCQIRGVQAFYRFTAKSRREAREYFEKAVTIDPDYIPALSALGHTLYQTARYLDCPDPQPLLDQVAQISAKLQQQDHSRAHGYALQCNLRHLEGQHQEAVAEARRAVDLAPDSPDHRGRLGMMLSFSGDPHEAIKQYHIAIQLSPHYPDWFSFGLVMSHYLAGDLRSAQQVAEQTVTRFPEFSSAYLLLAGTCSACDLQDEAAANASKFLALQPNFSLNEYVRPQLFARREDYESWAGQLRKAGLPD